MSFSANIGFTLTDRTELFHSALNQPIKFHHILDFMSSNHDYFIKLIVLSSTTLNFSMKSSLIVLVRVIQT